MLAGFRDPVGNRRRLCVGEVVFDHSPPQRLLKLGGLRQDVHQALNGRGSVAERLTTNPSNRYCGIYRPIGLPPKAATPILGFRSARRGLEMRSPFPADAGKGANRKRDEMYRNDTSAAGCTQCYAGTAPVAGCGRGGGAAERKASLSSLAICSKTGPRLVRPTSR